MPTLAPDEELALRETTRRFLADHVEPINRDLEADPLTHLPKVFAGLGALGLLGPFLPEEYGGGGSSIAARAAISEEVAYVNAGLDISMFADIVLFSRALANHASHEQKQRYLPSVLAGQRIGGMAITEPEGGSNALSPRTKAVRDGNRWILSGSKIFITNAPIADYLVVLARTSGEDRQIDGGTWFIVERGMPGLTTSAPFDKMGWKSSPTGEVYLDEVELSDDQVMGEVGRGFHYLVEALDVERVLVGASSIGLARACLDEAVSYAKDREVFGQPIAKFQLIQERIATMATAIEMSSAMLRQCLDAIEAGRRVTREAAMLKLYATQMAVQASNDAVQIFGGYGFMEENKVCRLYRDAKFHEAGAGTTEIMKVIIARETLARHSQNGRV